MRPALVLALAAVAATLLGIAAPRAYPPAAAADTTAAQRSITVNASGQARVAPDVAIVTVGVQQTSPVADQAQAAANRIVAAALARIKALGIPDRDIQTVGISLDPQYDSAGTLTGFTASDTLSITVEHPARAGAVIDAAVAAGANHDVGVSFGLKDANPAQAAALAAAVAAAQSKAAAVAAQLHLSLSGAKVQVVENVSQPVPFVGARAFTPGPAQAPSTPVQTGTLTIEDSVTVTYTL